MLIFIKSLIKNGNSETISIEGNLYEAGVTQAVQEFLSPLAGHYQPVDVMKFAAAQAFVKDADIHEVFFRGKKYPELEYDRTLKLLDLSGEDIVLSCLKKAEARDSYILRVYNISSQNRKFSIKAFKDIKEAYLVNIMERRLENICAKGKSMEEIPVLSREIVTVELVL